MEFEEGEGKLSLADRGQGTLKHLIQFELSKKESPLKEAVVEVRRMQGLRGWGCCLEGFLKMNNMSAEPAVFPLNF